jgi:hypothetical protein
MLTLPLWIVTEHIKPSDSESAEKKPGWAVAFSSSDKLFNFMKSNLGGEWKIEKADDRDGLVILIADLLRLNIESLTLNPDKDGNGGEQVGLTDLADYADSLKS